MAGINPYQTNDPRASVESVKLGMATGLNRSASNAKQPMSNNFVNRSLRGGLQNLADSEVQMQD